MENSAVGCGPLSGGESDICRLCMKTHECNLNIFVSNEEFKMFIGKAIEELLVLEVAQGDSLPETVCFPCVTRLKEFRDFKEICFDSARKLKGRRAPMEVLTCPMKVEIQGDELLDEGEKMKWNAFVGDQELVQPSEASEAFKCPMNVEIQDDELLDEGGKIKWNAFVEDQELVQPSEASEAFKCPMKVEIQDDELLDEGGKIKWNAFVEDQELVQPSEASAAFKCPMKVEVQDDELLDEGKIKWNAFVEDQEPAQPSEAFEAFKCPMNVEIQDDELLDEGEKIKWNAYFKDQELAQESVASEVFKSGFKDEEASEFCGENDEGEEEVPMNKDYYEGATVYIESSALSLGNQCGVKEELLEEEAMESMAGVHYEIMMDANDEYFLVESDLLDVGKTEHSLNMVDILQEPVKECHHEDDGTQYLAQNNGLYLPFPDTLYGASISETRTKTFHCGVCGKEFDRRCDLMKHSDTRTGLMPLKCDVCGKTFCRKNDLKIHAISHTDLKPFKCKVCGEEFNWLSCLKMHQIIHADSKSFDCEVCGKTFGKKCELEAHAIIRSDLRPFKCGVCGNVYKRKNDLRRHSAVHKV